MMPLHLFGIICMEDEESRHSLVLFPWFFDVLWSVDFQGNRIYLI